MRYLLILMLFLPFPCQAGSYTVPQDTRELLHDALQPLTEANRMAKFTALEYLHYRLDRDSELIRPYLVQLEEIYQSPALTGEPRASVAAVLLVLGSQLNATGLRLEALKESRDVDRPEQVSTPGLIKGLAEEARPEEADLVLNKLFEYDLPLQWYSQMGSLRGFSQIMKRLLPSATPALQPDFLARLVRIRMKLEERFANDRLEEQKFSGMITIWDHSTEADVAVLLRSLDETICAIPTEPGKAAWRYLFVNKANMIETGATRELACPLQEVQP